MAKTRESPDQVFSYNIGFHGSYSISPYILILWEKQGWEILHKLSKIPAVQFIAEHTILEVSWLSVRWTLQQIYYSKLVFFCLFYSQANQPFALWATMLTFFPNFTKWVDQMAVSSCVWAHLSKGRSLINDPHLVIIQFSSFDDWKFLYWVYIIFLVLFGALYFPSPLWKRNYTSFQTDCFRILTLFSTWLFIHRCWSMDHFVVAFLVPMSLLYAEKWFQGEYLCTVLSISTNALGTCV